MKFGLSEAQLSELYLIFRSVPQIEKSIVFGSRAMGNFKPHSDLDLLIVGAEVTRTLVASLSSKLNDETSLPIKFDLINDNDELTPAFRAHISDHGSVFYTRPLKIL